MAYKQGHNPADDVIRRNQEAVILNGISCCTCGYCIKMQVQPTVTFKNFRAIPAQAISPENGYQQYIFPTIAASEFIYNLDYNLSLQGEFWKSANQLERNFLATTLNYNAFRNCKGSRSNLGVYAAPSNLFFPSSYLLYQSNFNWNTSDDYPCSPNAAPYESLFSLFDGANLCSMIPGRMNGAISLTNNNGRPYVTLPLSNCRYDSISNTYQTFNIGNYQSLFDYIDANDYSLMVKKDSNCENNIAKVTNVFERGNYNTYTFPFVYDGYQFVSSLASNVPDNFLYPQINPNNVVKEGYVLNRLSIDLEYKTVSCRFGMNPETDFYATLLSCSGLTTYPESMYPMIYSKTFYQTSLSFYSLYNGNVYQEGGYYGNFALEFASSLWWFHDSLGYSSMGTESWTTETGPSGVSKITITGLKFQGPKYLTTTYVNSLGANRGVLSGHSPLDYLLDRYITPKPIPLNYNATLSMGFMCDIEINVQSVPICKTINIPGTELVKFDYDGDFYFKNTYAYRNEQLRRSEKLKVTFSGYRKTQQTQTFHYDEALFMQSQSPLLKKRQYQTQGNEYLNNIIFAPPDTNADEPFYLSRKSGYWANRSLSFSNSSIIKEDIALLVPIKKKYVAKLNPYMNYDFGYAYGRVYLENGYPEEFKSTFLVNGDSSIWETGNKIDVVTQGSAGNSQYFTVYCIFIKTVSDKSQSAGQTLIRIATTKQNAIEGKNIEIIDLGNVNTRVNGAILTVEYDSYFKKEAKVPSYSNFRPQDYYLNNPNLDKIGASYTTNVFPFNYGEMPTWAYWYRAYPAAVYAPLTPYPLAGEFLFGMRGSIGYFSQNVYISGFESTEVVSLSPIIIKYWGVVFSFDGNPYYAGREGLTDFNYIYTLPNNMGTGISNGRFGFTCDITIEEQTNEFTQNSLPSDFNGLLTMQTPITSTDPSYKKSLRVIPDRCEHIGKVTDRKDCNCPQKWIRECDIHGSTDWKNCMRCKDYKAD